MSDPINFNKKTFVAFINTEYGFSREQAGILYDAIAAEMKTSLLSGGLIKVFGLGAIKATMRRDRASARVRFRPAPSIDISSVIDIPDKDNNDKDMT